eukprot:jgi/Tetstr1/425912/TSEL_001590.t1
MGSSAVPKLQKRLPQAARRQRRPPPHQLQRHSVSRRKQGKATHDASAAAKVPSVLSKTSATKQPAKATSKAKTASK